jgi:hypothetical protein
LEVVVKLALHYRGLLRSNGDALHKHQIRLAFHEQLQMLWNQLQLASYKKYVTRKPITGDYGFLLDVGGITFAPLVTTQAHTTAELRVTLLRPGPVGGLLQGGDIDNRLKTLFDALAVPPHANQIPAAVNVADAPRPFFSLLEDDRLVTMVEVRTEQLLEQVDDGIVDLTIQVRTRVEKLTNGNDIFG